MVSKKTSLELHTIDKYENAVPPSTKEELDALKESITLQGLMEPIVCNSKGVILDGHQRFQICGDYGIKPKHRILDFPTEEEEFQYVIECNVNRRQLNVYQKVELFQGLLDFYKKRAEANIRATQDHIKVPYAKGGSAVQFSKSIGCGVRRVQDCLYIMAHGKESTKERLRNGTISVNTAYQSIKTNEEDDIKQPSRKEPLNYKCPNCEHVFKRRDLSRFKVNG